MMEKIFTFIKQKQKMFCIIAAVIEALIFGVAGFFLILRGDTNGFLAWSNCFVIVLCSLAVTCFHYRYKIVKVILSILRIAFALPILFSYFSNLGPVILIISAAFSAAEIMISEVLEIKEPIAKISIHCVNLGLILALSIEQSYEPLFESDWIITVVILCIVSVLEMVFYAFVYIGTSRWVCPDCHRINKGKAKFCVGCGKVRPVEPKPVRKPRPAPAYAAPAPQPITAAPQPSAAEPQPEGTNFCSECGAPLDPGSVFCGQCGKPLK